MQQNPVKQQLKAGKPSVGTWLTFPDPFLAEAIGTIGFDWLNVDMEHNPINLETAALMFMAIRSQGGVPLARIPWNNAENVKRVLDCGAWGIVFPMVNSRAEAEEAVAAAKYPLRGFRSVGGGRHALSFGTNAPDYYKHADDELLVVVQAEHIKSVENIDEILSVPGIDAVFIGPNDLAASMGYGPGYEREDADVVAAIKKVRESAVAHGVAPGIHCSGGAAVARRVAEGFQFCALASDGRLLLANAKAELGQAR